MMVKHTNTHTHTHAITHCSGFRKAVGLAAPTNESGHNAVSSKDWQKQAEQQPADDHHWQFGLALGGKIRG